MFLILGWVSFMGQAYHLTYKSVILRTCFLASSKALIAVLTEEEFSGKEHRLVKEKAARRVPAAFAPRCRLGPSGKSRPTGSPATQLFVVGVLADLAGLFQPLLDERVIERFRRLLAVLAQDESLGALVDLGLGLGLVS